MQPYFSDFNAWIFYHVLDLLVALNLVNLPGEHLYLDPGLPPLWRFSIYLPFRNLLGILKYHIWLHSTGMLDVCIVLFL